MLAPGDLRQQGRGGIQRSGLGQELNPGVPPVTVVDRDGQQPIQKGSGSIGPPGSPIRRIGSAQVRGRGLEVEAGQVVEEQVRLVGAVRPATHVSVAEVREERALLALEPRSGYGCGSPALPYQGSRRRDADQWPVCRAGRLGPGLERGSISTSRSIPRPAPVPSPIAVVIGHETEPVSLAKVPLIGPRCGSTIHRRWASGWSRTRRRERGSRPRRPGGARGWTGGLAAFPRPGRAAPPRPAPGTAARQPSPHPRINAPSGAAATRVTQDQARLRSDATRGQRPGCVAAVG